MKTTTTGLSIVRAVWDHHSGSIGWETLNHSLREALHIAIATRMTFEPDDFETIKQFRPSYWLGEHWFEGPYCEALVYGNTSFVKAFEEHFKRPGFIANNVCYPEPRPRLHHRMGTRQRGRLAMWCKFGGGWRVTSMHTDYVVAVGHTDKKRRVVKFTRDMLKEQFPAPKKANPEQEESTE